MRTISCIHARSPDVWRRSNVPGAAAAHTSFEHFRTDTSGRIEVFDIAASGPLDRERLRRGNYIDAMALVRRTAWIAVGGYSEMDKMGWEDYDFWCKFVEKGLEMVFIPEILCRYRVHETSMLRSHTNKHADALKWLMMARHPWLDLRHA